MKENFFSPSAPSALPKAADNKTRDAFKTDVCSDVQCVTLAPQLAGFTISCGPEKLGVGECEVSNVVRDHTWIEAGTQMQERAVIRTRIGECIRAEKCLDPERRDGSRVMAS